MRTLHDCILVGIGTILHDDPRLTARLLEPGEETIVQQPQPIVLDSSLRFPLSASLLGIAKGGGKSPWIFTSEKHDVAKRLLLEKAGAKVFTIRSEKDGRLSLTHLLSTLKSSPFSISRLMVEGGSRIIKSFLSSGLVDHLIITIAPVFVGCDGVAVIDNSDTTSFPNADLESRPAILYDIKYKQFGKDIVMSAKLRRED